MSIHDEIRSGISCVYTLTFTLPWDLVDWLGQASTDDVQRLQNDLLAVHQAMHGGTSSPEEWYFEYHTYQAAEQARPRILKVLAEYTALARSQQPQP